jgi:RNA polymerase sigma factor (sigma-70 family)
MVFETESILVRACLDGNHEAQCELYDRYKGKMFAMCLRYAGSRSQAQDMLQDGFLQVYIDLHQYRHEGSFEGWMRRVILHVIYRTLRKEPHLLPFNQEEEAVYQPDSNDDEFRQRTARELIAMMQHLAPGFRTVLNMYIFEGYNHKEIGAILGISEGTSKSQFMRAKAALREIYETKLQ